MEFICDFSSTNPLNLAARKNDVFTVKRLLKKKNPNCVDNRGWTCLHEAAANNSLDCLKIILKHAECRPLAETYEGHTALYLACDQHCSLEIIKTLLEEVEDISNYASTEMVSPLHVVCVQGRLEVIELLLKFDAIIDIADFDGDTPLHDAAFVMQHEVVDLLLHAGAQSEIRNSTKFVPLHLASLKGCLKTVQALHPFIYDINLRSCNGETSLMLATQNGAVDVVLYLLNHNADPDIKNCDGDLALKIALIHGNADAFKILLPVTSRQLINKDIIVLACKPHYFNMDIILSLLESDIGPEFFNVTENFYVTLEKIGDIRPSYAKNSPLNSFLHISEYIYNQSEDLFIKLFYLFLMRGVAVDALYIDECPPLVYIHYCEHTNCFKEVFQILTQQGCNVDYCTVDRMPDAILASIATGGTTTANLLQYSFLCDPDMIFNFIKEADILGRISTNAQNNLLSLLECSENISIVNYQYLVPTLKHLCRLKIRSVLRLGKLKTTAEYMRILQLVPLPKLLHSYLQYL